ncbi:MAG TPA: cupin domain-containing protein [Gaiellaceae bacterium]|nr:cupin domain-containing protein [Gaiellaceae bacterium]
MFTIDLDDFELVPSRPGLRVNFPFHSASGTTSTASVLFELDPGAELPVHTDSAEELLVVVQGTAEARVADEIGMLRTHEVALVPPMAPHGLRNVGEDVLRVFGTFSSATVVSTFERPFEPGGPQVFVIGAPMPVALPLGERVAV